MNEQGFYNTIAQPSTAEFKDRGSKFIAYAFPIETMALGDTAAAPYAPRP